MALKIKIIVLILFLSNNVFASENGKIFFTDKYDANYFSSSSTQNTKLYFGSDLFIFFDTNSLQTCGVYIDSFLRSENIIFDSNLSIENGNRFRVELGLINATECRELSRVWTEEYKIEFQKLLFGFVKKLNFDSITLNSNKIIFKKLVIDELTRFYNPSNNVNNTNIAFVIPRALSNNNFKKVFTHYNTKRYSARETQLTTTEIVYNNELQSNQIRYIYPSTNKHSFLKNCQSLSILELLFKEKISFNTEYNINQCISSFTISSTQNNLTDFTVFFNEINISENELNKLKNESLEHIINTCSESLFYYSFYDIEKLKALQESYNLKMLNSEVKSLNDRRKFILELTEDNNFRFKNYKIQAFNLSNFQDGILFKRNSTDFVNEEDSLLINKLKLFMEINENYSLNIVGNAKRNEYLFVEKYKKDTLMNKYSEFGYRISKRKDLALYRALLTFSDLTDSGIKYSRLNCVGRKTKTPMLELNLFIED